MEGTDNDRRSLPRAAFLVQTAGGSPSGVTERYGIIFVCSAGGNMEAEELNQLANTLADLRERASGLRRYL